MGQYHYKFDLTTGTVALGTTDTVPNEGYDLSEFDGDSRGTPRVADWSDVENMTEAQFDLFRDALEIVPNSSFYVSWTGHPTYYAGNDYYRETNPNRPFWIRVQPLREGGWHEENVITYNLYEFGSKNIVLGSWSPADMKVLVYFTGWEPNGGHESINITIN